MPPLRTAHPAPALDLETLDQFFSLAVSGSMFESTGKGRDDPGRFPKLRNAVRDSLFRLLVWERPCLESTRGIDWPYDGLRKLAPIFEKKAALARSPWVREEAERFLLLLPFPGQWRRLLRAQQKIAHDPEVARFFQKEAREIREKLDHKGQTTFRLRHFCQVLKKPRLPDEKGVLRIFSLPYIFTAPGLLEELAREYLFYVEPPMGVVCRHGWWRAFTGHKDPSLFGVGAREDAVFLHTQAGVVTTELAHGDFLDHRVEVPRATVKDFDLVFNATFDDMPRKRHIMMLSLLNHPSLNRKTALFLGRGTRENIEAFRKRALQEGLEKRVKIVANIPREDVPGYLAKCGVGVGLSLYESACRSIYEFFRSDLPCVISSSMAGMNLDIFTPQTGMAAPDQDLAQAIAAVIRNRHRFSPRKWFLNHSGSENASKTLNERLKTLFHRRGYTWREDIIPLTSSGASRYADPAHLEYFRPELERLARCFCKRPHLPVDGEVDLKMT